MRNLVGISKKCTHFSFRAGWVKGSYLVGWEILRFLDPEFKPNHKKCLQGKKDAIFGWLVGGLLGIWLVCGRFMSSVAAWWVIYERCGWFVGEVTGLWVVCGWFGWFVGGFEFYRLRLQSNGSESSKKDSFPFLPNLPCWWSQVLWVRFSHSHVNLHINLTWLICQEKLKLAIILLLGNCCFSPEKSVSWINFFPAIGTSKSTKIFLQTLTITKSIIFQNKLLNNIQLEKKSFPCSKAVSYLLFCSMEGFGKP